MNLKRFTICWQFIIHPKGWNLSCQIYVKFTDFNKLSLLNKAYHKIGKYECYVVINALNSKLKGFITEIEYKQICDKLHKDPKISDDATKHFFRVIFDFLEKNETV